MPTSTLALTAYRAATRIASRLPIPAGPLATSLQGRRNSVAFWEDWARRARGPLPLIWLHAASVGEALAAVPVLRRLRAARALQIILTHSSPSVEGWPGDLGVDARGFVPLDEPRSVERTLDALRPALLLFSRGDLWPALVAAAANRALPVAVIGAAVRERSRRLAWPVRRLLRGMHEALMYVGAVTKGDAERWVRLGVRPEACTATGDPRHDHVLEQPIDFRGIEHLRAWAAGGDPVLIAGSVEEQDERPLFEALAMMRSTGARSRALIVPHDPTGPTVQRSLARLTAAGISAVSWRPGEAAPVADTVVVDGRGRLPDLYSLARAAYVGGGFAPRGLHAVIEPAACGVPIIVGPCWEGSQDAGTLITAGGALALPERNAASALAGTWRRWLDPKEAWRVGIAARGTIREGAATRGAGELLKLLPTT